jgi:sigma-B regulation protein RsbU (phosphoserine phosphatase)
MPPLADEWQIMSDNIGSIFQLGEVLETRLSTLEDKLEDQINKIVDLSRMGVVFTSVLDLEVVLPMLMETALSIVKGEVGEVVLFNREGQRKTVSWGLTPNVTDRLRIDTGEKVYDYIQRTGESVFLDNIVFESTDEASLAGINLISFIASPLKEKDRVIGAIAVANKEGEIAFNADDQFALEMLGSFAAVAVTNADLHREALQKQKMEHELELAKQVQNTLMPEHVKIFNGLGVYAYNAQASQVGGDFYDIIELGGGKYLVMVADVSNKGIPAALIMSSTRSYIRLAAENITSPAKLAAKINDLLCRDVKKLESIFVTMFIGLIDINRHKLICANAGHPPGFLFRGRTVTRLMSGGPFLGQFPDSTFREEETTLGPGDRLFLFTDGIFECVNIRDEMLGLDNAEEFLKENIKLPWDELLENLKRLLKTYSYDAGRVDDTTMMMIEMEK